MKFIKIPYELIDNENISFNDIGVYALLQSAHYQHTDFLSYMGVAELVEKSKLSIATLNRIIKKLQENSYIETLQRRSKLGQRLSNITKIVQFDCPFVKLDTKHISMQTDILGAFISLKRLAFNGDISDSKRTICRKLRVDSRTLNSYLEELEKLGMIILSKQKIHFTGGDTLNDNYEDLAW